MPIIKSARKRVKIAEKANLRNFRTKREMREAIKAFSKVLADGNAKQIIEAETAAFRTIDRAVKKAVIHRNKAARMKARLSTQAKAAGAKAGKAASVKPNTATKPKTATKASARPVKKTSTKASPAKSKAKK
jgi:small subunit ribosomal protein S20